MRLSCGLIFWSTFYLRTCCYSRCAFATVCLHRDVGVVCWHGWLGLKMMHCVDVLCAHVVMFLLLSVLTMLEHGVMGLDLLVSTCWEFRLRALSLITIDWSNLSPTMWRWYIVWYVGTWRKCKSKRDCVISMTMAMLGFSIIFTFSVVFSSE
jgi:hypothetical protein